MSTNAYNQIQRISSISSNTEREAQLKAYWNEPTNCVLRYALTQALDPFITHGISKMPKVEPGEGEFNEGTYADILRLQTRELSGNEAKQWLTSELERLNFESGELLKGIITGKLGKGISAKTINKIAPGTIYLFEICAAKKFNEHCHKITEEEWQIGVHGEIKEDGVRACSLPNKLYQFVSRNGLPLNSDQELRYMVEQMLNDFAGVYCGDRPDYYEGGLALDCELVSITESFNQSSGSSRSQDESRADKLEVRVIDALTLDEVTGPAKDTYETSRQRLEHFFSTYGSRYPRIKLIESFIFHSEQEVRGKFEEIHTNAASRGERKKEGLMIKRLKTKRKPSRIDGWLKVKGVIDVDLTVTSLVSGDDNGKYGSVMGAAVCDYVNEAGKVVEVKIGGGWSDFERAQYWATFTGKPAYYTKTVDGVATEIEALPDEDYVLVGKVIQVHAHEETEDGSLREPRYKQVRHDKTPEDGQGC